MTIDAWFEFDPPIWEKENMTTTEDKINELRRRQSAAEDEIKKIGKELALLRYPELKPPDPKLLEGWANSYESDY